jgi:hypothetical protein
MRSLPYCVGDVFAFPFDGRGHGVGVVARCAKRGKTLLGYFYGRVFPEIPNRPDVSDLRPQDAILIARFGDLHLFHGKWPIVSRIANWDQREWPMPPFIREELISNRKYLVTYSDVDPSAKVSDVRIGNDVRGYEPDLLRGADAVVIALTSIIDRWRQ